MGVKGDKELKTDILLDKLISSKLLTNILALMMIITFFSLITGVTLWSVKWVLSLLSLLF